MVELERIDRKRIGEEKESAKEENGGERKGKTKTLSRSKEKTQHCFPPPPLTSSPEPDVVIKLVALENQETTELVGVAVAVSCTGPPRVVTVGLDGVRLVEPKHALATQSCPTLQVVPQPPQLLTSVVVSTQDVEQSVGVAEGQVQTPERQDCASEGQMFPQEPQLEVSVWRSTHEAPQMSGVRAGHVQTPERQVCAVEGHAAAQVPQFWVSLARSTHAAPQRSGVKAGQVQMPERQDCATAQVVVQLPQAVGSFWRNLQPWSQVVLPVGQADVWLFVLSSWSDTVFVFLGKGMESRSERKKKEE